MADTWLDSTIALNRIQECIKADLSVTDARNLTVQEVYVLRILYRQDGQRPSDIAKRIGRTATSFTPLLDNLERAGFVRRSANLEDRRSVLIFLTAKGKRLEGVVNNAIANAEVKYGEG